MERRLCQRGRTDLAVRAHDGPSPAKCRGIEISSTGIVVDWGKLGFEATGLLVGLEIVLPECHRPLRALARPIWSAGSQQALKFVRMSDVDRLNLAEHVDLQWRRGRLLN